MNYLDRNNIASARLLGIEEEFHPTTDEWNVCHLFYQPGTVLLTNPDCCEHFVRRLHSYARYVSSLWIGQ